MVFVGALSKILDVPTYKIREPKVNVARDIATRQLITSHEFISYAEMELASKLEKNRIAEEQALSRAIRKKEKEKLAIQKKKDAAERKILGSKKKPPYIVGNHVVRNSEPPQVLSKRARTFVTPFVSQNLSNSVGS